MIIIHILILDPIIYIDMSCPLPTPHGKSVIIMKPCITVLIPVLMSEGINIQHDF